MNYIEVKDITTGYDGIPLTKHINFVVEKGDYLSIVGENGAGKSTLMKTLLRLVPPVKGEIVYSDELGKTDIGYLPQSTVVQRDFPASVWEIVLSGNLAKSGLRPFYNKEEKKRAMEALHRLDAWDLRKKTFRNLSGGQQQRVLLARALCATSKLILLDEPVSGLDPKVTEELYNIVKTLNKDGVTIIMISHDISTAVKYSSHILHLGHKQLYFGDTEGYQKSEAYKFFSTVDVEEKDDTETNEIKSETGGNENE
ncbi:MAG: metal ABC transporter ATP-binding protein [Eubacterium sp.]|nr:metal ABC transporter ATP-binding protein [Eubacterium sp.]